MSDPRPVVVFDFDGVLVAGDSFAGVIRGLIGARAWKRGLAIVTLPLVLPLFAHPATTSLAARAYFRLAFAGVAPALARESILARARAIVADPGRHHRDAVAALDAHRQAGQRGGGVSGSEETLVRTVLEGLGMAAVEVVASRLSFDGPRVRVLRHCFGAAKPRALAELNIHAWDWAYTDSLADLPLLRGAAHPVLVNASRAAVRRATRALGRAPELCVWR